MSQQQPPRRQALAEQFPQQQPIKYGDVFDVSGELASKPVTPGDAASMQAAENSLLGQTQKSGTAAAVNEKAGLVRHRALTDITRDQGVTISEMIVDDANRIITESVGDQVVAQYAKPNVATGTPGNVLDPDSITIGEALEVSALSAAGDKAVDQSDVAAIYAAEMRATGTNEIKPGGIGATAQSAATHNERTLFLGAKTTISDVLADASTKMCDDKAVTREDAEDVISAEIRNKPDMRTTPGGVGASMAAAARINQNN
ncbi:hypothetical protein LWI28_013331 [Acer negundo]|uniref:SMP domain-containing protein n=1 Tax=Acer negundo TaxID=4023 RepID=A0AAD5NV05_ACENE|nr:hypothetical protein LWI28_013331 [Acer negundo]KAK4847696.1 hypothetical protein QYF36_004810 [Acer negundo]